MKEAPAEIQPVGSIVPATFTQACAVSKRLPPSMVAPIAVAMPVGSKESKGKVSMSFSSFELNSLMVPVTASVTTKSIAFSVKSLRDFLTCSFTTFLIAFFVSAFSNFVLKLAMLAMAAFLKEFLVADETAVFVDWVPPAPAVPQEAMMAAVLAAAIMVFMAMSAMFAAQAAVVTPQDKPRPQTCIVLGRVAQQIAGSPDSQSKPVVAG
jgi:hypothetical protein